MESEIVISAEHLTKAYQLRRATGTRTLKSAVIGLVKNRRDPKEDFFALDDICFEVRKGETLGIIGANGAGKSTLLALLTGTISPTSGSVTTCGSISSLLELGAGFHPDLTGRENVYLYGAIMGISREKMQRRFDDIVDFAGLAKFIDQPVKHYSSGMYIRLAFAVAVEVDPDVLLIDEVLAVGDSDFQRKCLRKMSDFRDAGKTMLIISHDLSTVQSVSDRILLLDHGKLLGIGDPKVTIEEYESLARKEHTKSLRREWGTGEMRITGATFFDSQGAKTETLAWGRPIRVDIFYDAITRIEKPVFGFSVADDTGRLIFGNNTQIEGVELKSVKGKGHVSLCMDKLPLAAGTYLFSFSVHSSDHKVNYHRMDHCFPVAVLSEKRFEGCCHMDCRWEEGSQ